MEQFYRQMEAWNYDDPYILEIRQESLAQKPVRTFEKIFRFLDLLVPTKDKPSTWTYRLKAIVNKLIVRLGKPFSLWPNTSHIPVSRFKKLMKARSFEQLTGGREKGKENPRSHYRKGKPGDWKNHFNKEHKTYFKKHFGELLVKLGYEQDMNW
jgi:hypothetical protein